MYTMPGTVNSVVVLPTSIQPSAPPSTETVQAPPGGPFPSAQPTQMCTEITSMPPQPLRQCPQVDLIAVNMAMWWQFGHQPMLVEFGADGNGLNQAPVRVTSLHRVGTNAPSTSTDDVHAAVGIERHRTQWHGYMTKPAIDTMVVTLRYFDFATEWVAQTFYWNERLRMWECSCPHIWLLPATPDFVNLLMSFPESHPHPRVARQAATATQPPKITVVTRRYHAGMR